MPDHEAQRAGLTLSHVKITRGARTLVDINDHVDPGETLTVMGPSGAGKSTLLSYIIGTLDPTFTARGRVLLNGTDITQLAPEQRHVGILFQDELLFPHLSVGENLAFGLRPTVRSRTERKRRIDAALTDIGLTGFADRDPETLSGGQKARVALMRMLLSEPKALLLDEPFSRLDAARRDQIRTLVFAQARSKGLPVLLVTHDHADADAAQGRVHVLNI
ncbi:ATP-binding cassette domain-containing protein [Marivita sp. S2033]|uniref:ATP-binding cassette domain-containing protein n=1 Tax=Marivita sp. S2033 TaxID=3373187 RepID=UPI0039821952